MPVIEYEAIQSGDVASFASLHFLQYINKTSLRLFVVIDRIVYYVTKCKTLMRDSANYAMEVNFTVYNPTQWQLMSLESNFNKIPVI